MADINFLGSIALGKVNSWDDAKEATISPISFPGLDSGKTEGIDTLGIIAYFNMSGRFTGSFETIQGKIYDIKNIADGKQTSSVALKSPFMNSNIYDGTTKYRRNGHIGTNTSTSANELIDSTANFSTWGIQGTDDSAVTFDKVKNLTTGVVANVVAIRNGTATSTSASKLIDSNATFTTWGITTGDVIKNKTDSTVTTVVSRDSQTQLTLTDDIFASGNAWGVENKMTLSADIFTTSATYAVTANINVKVLDFRIRWELPGLSYCNYSMSVMQVR